MHVHPTLYKCPLLKDAIFSDLLHISLLPCMLHQRVHACAKRWWWFHADGQLNSTTPPPQQNREEKMMKRKFVG